MVEYLSPWAWPKEYHSWNWEGFEGVPLLVSVYSRCDKVILELNNQVIDTINISEFKGLISRINIPYQAGMLTAIGIKEGKRWQEKSYRQPENLFQLRIAPEKEQIVARADDLAYFNVEVMDDLGKLVPDAEVIVSFTIRGKCHLAAVGNSNPQDMKSFQSSTVKTFMGRCQLIVRLSEGEKNITVTAQAQGLKLATTGVQLN
ncbi:MAG: DUF4982 domain-containing protein [Saprospiraceae bacterium]|nr:DUF4982 domain-containing protein [Saprospiraceae bacterium]